MKALTIAPHYASLIANSHKQIETRSWPTKYRGFVLIHASASMKKKYVDEYYNNNSIAKALKSNRQNKTHLQLPKGVIVAVAELYDCKRMVYTLGREESGEFNFLPMQNFNTDEYNFGYYEQGRYAWLLRNVQKFVQPLPAKGQLGLWNLEINYNAIKRYYL